MKSTTTNLKVSGIKESPNNVGSASLLGDFSISEFLYKRKITNEIIKEFGLYVDVHPVVGKVLVIPINNSFNKYRRSPESDEQPKYLYDKGSTADLYCKDRIKDCKEVVVCEGELDALVCWSFGIPAVSTTGGSMTFLPEWIEYLKDKEVTLCYDNDRAGGAGMAKVFELIPESKLLFLPDEIKDLSELAECGVDIKEYI